MTEPAGSTFRTYVSPEGRRYRYTVAACDRDLDHGDACLFTFVVQQGARSFEKVIAVNPSETGTHDGTIDLPAALEVAERKLYAKLDAGNEADEPTPLR